MQRRGWFTKWHFAFLILLCLASYSLLPAQTRERDDAPQAEGGQVLQSLLSEVRQLRLTLQRAQVTAHRAQIAVERLRAQREHVDRLTSQLDQAQNEASTFKLSSAQMEEQLKEFENQIQQAPNADRRAELQVGYKGFQTLLAQQSERDTQLRDRQARLTEQLQVERSKLEEINNQLSVLEREMVLPQ